MKLPSKYKNGIFIFGAILLIILIFVSGNVFGPKLFKSAISSNVEYKSCDYDVIGNGDPILNRNWRELHLGMSKAEVESRLDSISSYFNYKKSERFINTEVLELADPENGFADYVPAVIYFYKDKVVMIKLYTETPDNGRADIVMNNLKFKYSNLDSLYYTNSEQSVGAIKRRQQGIHIPKFLPQFDNDRIYELRDGHTIINIFDAHNLGVCVLMYDRHSRYIEDVDSLRQNRL